MGPGAVGGRQGRVEDSTLRKGHFAAWARRNRGKKADVKFHADQLSDSTPFNARGGSAPTGFVGPGDPQEFLNVRLQQAEPNVPVKLLAPLV